jgi:hypothetical protein
LRDAPFARRCHLTHLIDNHRGFLSSVPRDSRDRAVYSHGIPQHNTKEIGDNEHYIPSSNEKHTPLYTNSYSCGLSQQLHIPFCPGHLQSPLGFLRSPPSSSQGCVFHPIDFHYIYLYKCSMPQCHF